jgi:hypothetical protein
LSLSLFIVRYCTVLLARGVSVFVLLFLLSVVSLPVCCQVGVSLSVVPYFWLSCPDLLFLTYWLFATCFDLFGLLSGPNSMYSTVGEMLIACSSIVDVHYIGCRLGVGDY